MQFLFFYCIILYCIILITRSITKMSANKRNIEKRSNSRQGYRISYDPSYESASDIDYYETTRSPSSAYHMQTTKYDGHSRAPSESNRRLTDQYYKGHTIRPSNDGVVSNLKSELQTLKLQVNRMMKNDSDSKSQRSSMMKVSGITSNYGSEQRLSLDKFRTDKSDIFSVTSDNLMNNPLKKLSRQVQEQGYDHAHYLQLENDLLKTELRNLKNKYNATKQQLKQKCQALQKKNQYLQISLRKSEHQLYDCKKKIEVELQTIKFQLSRKKYQSQPMNKPQKDYHSSTNQQFKAIYQQLAQKNQTINSLSQQLTDIQGQFQKKKFELKKQLQKNGEMTKQLQITKRQQMRNQTILQEQINNKDKLIENNQILKNKIKQLTLDLSKMDQIAGQSQRMQQRLTHQSEYYKNQTKRLGDENYEIASELNKFIQLNQSHQTQIKYLKNNISEYVTQLQQLSNKMRTQKQKSLQMQQYYRKALDEANQAKKRQQIKYEKLSSSNNKYDESIVYTNTQQKQNQQNQQNNNNSNQNWQIKKWKNQYKLLKNKYQEIVNSSKNKKQQIESYYKSYKQYKSKNRILELRNKVLEDSANTYIQKIQMIEAVNLDDRATFQQRIRQLEYQVSGLQKLNQQQTYQLDDQIIKNQMKTQQLNQELNYRKQIEMKIVNMNIDQPNSIEEVLESLRNGMEEQNQRFTTYQSQLQQKQLIIINLKKDIKKIIDNQQSQFRSFKNKEINEIVSELKNTNFESLQEMKKLSQKQLQIERQSRQELLNENSSFKSKIQQFQGEIFNLKEQNYKIISLYNSKLNQFVGISEKDDKNKSNLQTAIEEINKQNQLVINNLYKQIAQKSEEIASLRDQVMRLYNIKINPQNSSLDQNTKKQLEAFKKLSEEIVKKNQQVYRLRDSLSNLRADFDNLKSATDIAKLRFIADKKNIQVNYDVGVQQFKNQLSIQRKKLQTLQQKIRLILGQNRKKDVFIQNCIIGKKLPKTQKDFVLAFLKQYEITVTEKQISEKLQNDSQELEKLIKYNLNLIKEIANLKERLLFHEADSEIIQVHQEFRE